MTPEQSCEKSPPLGLHIGDAAHALLAAIAQIGLALRESQGPVAELGSVFAHVMETLSAFRSAALGPGSDDPLPAVAVRGLIEQFQSDVFKGIQQLQFYDRMVQHLSHLQEYLISAADELDSVKTAEEARYQWAELHAKLRERLISDEQRVLLDLILAPDAGTCVSPRAPCPDHSAPGSLELF
jgi:hypothetical protein